MKVPNTSDSLEVLLDFQMVWGWCESHADQAKIKKGKRTKLQRIVASLWLKITTVNKLIVKFTDDTKQRVAKVSTVSIVSLLFCS